LLLKKYHASLVALSRTRTKYNVGAVPGPEPRQKRKYIFQALLHIFYLIASAYFTPKMTSVSPPVEEETLE
jgi:hypothetical protein